MNDVHVAVESRQGMRRHQLAAGFVRVDGSENVLHGGEGVASAGAQVLEGNAVADVLKESMNSQRERGSEIGDAGIETSGCLSFVQ